MNARRRARSTQARAIALCLSLVAVTSFRPARGEPGDIFQLGAPVIGAPAPKAADLHIGDASVSPTGAFQYGYPIAVPPGRQNMQPSLALGYSSQSPIYGTIASGWVLSGLHTITLDTSNGRLINEGGGPPKRYTSSMAGGRPLVPVEEGTGADVAEMLRAQNDATWVRYQRMSSSSPFRWRALSPDGTTYYFGDTDHVGDCSIVSDEYAPITRAVDKFGNAIDYFWSAGPQSECHIHYITWGQNAVAGVQTFAAAVFDFAEMPTCAGAPIGGQISFRTGTKIGTGTSRLHSITLAAFPPGAPNPPAQIIPASTDHTRVITLAYDAQTEVCNATHAAYRTLASIQESAWGADSPRVDLPAVVFSYGAASFGQDALQWQITGSSFAPWQPGRTPSPAHYNLGWGYRFANGQWPTVEAMMVDIDGDSLIDRLINYPLDDVAAGKTKRCRAAWQRNLGGMSFATAQPIEMPTLKWATHPLAPPFSGGAYAGEHFDYGPSAAGAKMELCALNYQLTGYTNSFYPGGGVSCATAGTCTNYLCPGTHDDCSDKNLHEPTHSILAFRWMDVDGDQRIDLVASPVKGGLVRYNLQQGNSLGAPAEPAMFGAFPDCPSPSFTAYSGLPSFPADPNMPYTMCGGMFPWFVYLNHGDGQFGIDQGADTSPLPDRILYQPLPLETTNGDSSITSAPVGQNEGLSDLDGDGFLDAAKIDLLFGDWWVYRNANDPQQPGAVKPASGATPFSYIATSLKMSRSAYTSFTPPPSSSTVLQREGMLDVNGDGLSDHWYLEADNVTTTLRRNDGLGFGVPPISLSQRPSNDGASDAVVMAGSVVVTGSRVDSRRTVDMDLDGRVDLLRDPTGGNALQVCFNQGGEFSDPAGHVAIQTTTQHLIVASDQFGFYNASVPSMLSWEIRSDLIDLDGDSIPEGLYFGQLFANPADMDLWKIATPTQPPRLLVGIDNQRGATTTISYASTSNAAVVVQTPSEGKTMPRPQWVVQSHSTTDSLDSPVTVATTSYKYVSPRWSADDERRYGHRGFERIDTTLPSGAVREDHYSFAVDWSGRLATSIVHPAEDLGAAHTIDLTTWQARELFDGALITYHPVVREHLICSNGQTAATCNEATAAGYTQTISTLTPIVVGSTELLVETQSLLQGALPADGDRRTDTEYSLVADDTTYRLVTTGVTKHHRDAAGGWHVYAKTAKVWDTSYRVVTDEDVWFADAATSCTPTAPHCARTHRVYDMTTGNLLERIKPVQWAAGGAAKTSYTFDARKLFAVTELNEAGLQLEFAYEYGTGTKLLTAGPNVGSCSLDPPSCPAGTTIKEERRSRVDGLGRTIERWEPYSAQAGNVVSYTPVKVETYTYEDTMPGSSGPTSVTHTAYVNTSATDSKDVTELDGHGRPIKKTVFVFGSAPADHVTTFHYDHDGTLKEVRVPDPTQNNASTVTYRYELDSLGRPTSMRRPDSATESQQSGVDIHYDGLETTTEELVGTDGGQPAVTRTTTDRYGRLELVEEQRTAQPSYAATVYEYGPDDLVTTIVGPAPDLVTTNLVHDFAGRRTEITRGSRTWRYSYDKNGNRISETTPCSPVPVCEVAYTTTIVYDGLDRPVSKYVAPRDMSPTDIALFGLHHEKFAWDYGVIGHHGNYKGRLSNWRAYAAASEASANVVRSSAKYYQPQGQPTLTTEWFQSAALNLTREHLRQYSATGVHTYSHYRDFMGSGGYTTASISHDRRGLPSSIVLTPVGAGGNRTIATFTRNVAGLVTKRYAPGLGGPMTFVESNWTYDKLGRVTSQAVQKGPGPVQVARQELAYNGNDDPKTLDHWLGAANHKHFEFDYDRRHQLTTVSETALPNAFGATYEYGEAGRFSRALETAAALPGGDVAPRDVRYRYEGDDPEQVTSLVHTANELLTYASYDYDLAGNQMIRCNGVLTDTTCSGDSIHYLYDGEDQLRRATKKDSAGNVLGSEEYWYDGEGRRVVAVKRDASGNKTGVIFWIVDVEAHYDGAGVAQRVYSHVTLGTPVARVERTAPAAVAYEFQYHGLANNTLATVANWYGTINTSFMYAPFGEIIEATDAGAPTSGIDQHRRRFNDKYVDEISDLAYYGFRYYDKTSMTWTQSDPLYRFEPDAAWGEPRRANLYTAHLNNPLRFLDPDGRDVLEDIIDAALTVGRFGTKFFLALDDSGKSGPQPMPITNAETPEYQAFQEGFRQATEAEPARIEGTSTVDEDGGGAKNGKEVIEKGTDTVAGHRKNKRESNREKHERGDERRKRDKGGERGDDRRRPPRKRPPGHRGPWPPPVSQSDLDWAEVLTEGSSGGTTDGVKDDEKPDTLQ